MISISKYIVYAHIFPNNKRYIGITQQESKKRWGSKGSGYKGQLVYNAIKKYGWDNIEHVILYDNLTEDDAKAKEIDLIAKYNTTDDKYGYNIHEGGGYAPILCDAENPNAKRVICVNTGDIFDTITQASIKHNICVTAITACCKGKRHTAGGLVWQYYDNYLVAPKDLNSYKPVGRSKQVLCVETGIIYKSAQDAADNTNIDSTGIRKTCTGKQKTAGNMHWRYIE